MWGVYAASMKAVTVTMPEEVDAQAAAEARRLGISKSELILRGLAAILPAASPQEDDNQEDDNPLLAMAGFGSRGISVEPGEINEVVYGS